MLQVLKKLEENGTYLYEINALEVFGRKRDRHTVAHADNVKELEVWEIDSKYLKLLQKNLSDTKIKILDSILTLKRGKIDTKYNFIIFDNPMNVFGKIVYIANILKLFQKSEMYQHQIQ